MEYRSQARVRGDLSGHEGGYGNFGSIGLVASRQPCAFRLPMPMRFTGLVIGQYPADDCDIQNDRQCQQRSEEPAHHIE